MMAVNPFEKLWTKIKDPWEGENENLQTRNTRLVFKKLFTWVAESDPTMEFCALHFFSMQELNIVKIVLGERRFRYQFLPWFTKNTFLINKNDLKYFIIKIYQRGHKLRLRYKPLDKQKHVLVTKIIAKLRRIGRIKKVDRRMRLKKMLKETGLGPYFKYLRDIGMKFSNRQEVDEINNWCLRLINKEVT